MVKVVYYVVFFFRAEDCIRDLVRSRGLGDVYKRQAVYFLTKYKSVWKSWLNDDAKKKLANLL